MVIVDGDDESLIHKTLEGDPTTTVDQVVWSTHGCHLLARFGCKIRIWETKVSISNPPCKSTLISEIYCRCGHKLGQFVLSKISTPLCGLKTETSHMSRPERST